MPDLRRPGLAATLTGLTLTATAGVASAHVGTLGDAGSSGSVPTWLTVMTGGIVVGASFLFTSLLTDHETMRRVNWAHADLQIPDSVVRGLHIAGGIVAVVLLAAIVTFGVTGPPDETRNFAIVFVWVAWWAGFTISTYLLGNTWPLVNPWRAIASVGNRAIAVVLSERRTHSLPERLGAWPSVVGLLALIWVEVVSPVGSDPLALAAVVLAYSVVTVAGAIVYGGEWFTHVDPVSRVFRLYGHVAPLQRTDDGLSLTLPGTHLTTDPLSDTPGETAFVVALLWATTYDGMVATDAWETALTPLVDIGIPPRLIYLLAIVAGFGAFLGVYRLAARKARETADSYVTGDTIQRWIAPSLLPIAAGYHIAHFLGYVVALTPTFAAVAASPFAPPQNPLVFVLPTWFATVELLCVLAGHLLAIWVAHSISFELFPGVLKPVRSQYPFVVAMIFYTMTSMWVITQPFTPPPFV
jgi:hypothetical protein